MKELTAAFLLYSSSTWRFLRWRKKRNRPPTAAAIATKPTTTPAAIAALLGPDFELAGIAVDVTEEDGVTKIVCPANC
jgi:hypothetical protein